MTALLMNRYTKYRDGLISAHPVKGNSRIFKGSLVCCDATGYAVPGSDAAGLAFLGIALEEANNTGGADGAIRIRVQTQGVFSLAKSGAITQANLGQWVYVSDDQTVALAPTVTNDVLCGRLEGLDEQDVWVRLAY